MLHRTTQPFRLLACNVCTRLVRAELLSSPAVYRLGDGIGVRHHAGAQQQGLKSPDYQEQAARITGSLDSSCVETD